MQSYARAFPINMTDIRGLGDFLLLPYQNLYITWGFYESRIYAFQIKSLHKSSYSSHQTTFPSKPK